MCFSKSFCLLVFYPPGKCWYFAFQLLGNVLEPTVGGGLILCMKSVNDVLQPTLRVRSCKELFDLAQFLSLDVQLFLQL